MRGGYSNYRPLFLSGAVVVAIAVLYCVAAGATASKVPRGTTVVGVEIGGLTSEDAIEQLQRSFASSADARVRVAVGEQETWINPKAAGFTFSAADTVRQVTGATFSPVRVWRHLIGGGELAPVVLSDRGTAITYLDSVGRQTEIRAVDGTVSVAAAQVVVSEPVDGVQLDVEEAVEVVAKSFLAAEEPWILPTKTVRPTIGPDQVQAAVTEIAEPLLSGPVSLIYDESTVQLSVPELAALAEIVEDSARPGVLSLTWEEARLKETIDRSFPELAETRAQQASFFFEGDQPVIADAVAGTMLDNAALVAAITQAATAPPQARQIAVPLLTIDPAADRAALESLGIVEMVARAEISGPEPESEWGAVQEAADRITGQLVRPEEEFSLKDALGSWDPALDGLATAVFNAGFDAGMVDVDHTPHPTYVARFGMGREAALTVDSDVVFRNDTPWGVLVRAGLTEDHRVWVELWSTPYWTVETEIGEPGSFISARTIESSGPGCTDQPDGSAGFEIDYWRTRTSTAGETSGRETWSWRYAPTNIVSCQAAE
jgi:vancomycin resistance protein YoaR